VSPSNDEWRIPDLPPVPLSSSVTRTPGNFTSAVEPATDSEPKFTRSKKRNIILLVLFACFVAFEILGFFLPWITVNRGYIVPSYSAVDIPVASELGFAWSVFLVALAATAWILRQRWLLIVGAFFATITAVVLGVLAIVIHVVPRILPLWLIPKSARGYVPDITSGNGPTLAFMSGVLLLAWFVTAAVYRHAQITTIEGSISHQVERRFEAFVRRVRQVAQRTDPNSKE
jgi:hypothetical protein